MPLQTSSTPARAGSTLASFGCLLGIGLVFGLPGLFGLVMGIRSYPTDPKAISGIIVGGVFTLLGTALVLTALFGYGSAKTHDALKAANPDKPWMWREDWATGNIKDSNKGAAIAFWIFALIWNGVSFPIAIAMKSKMAQEPLALFILLFPLVGVFLLVAAIKQTVRALKYGTSRLHLERVPIVPGRAFRGDIQLTTDVIPENGYHLRLVSIHSVTTGRGKSRSTHDTVMFDSEITVDTSSAMRGPNGTRVPFQMAIPPDSHPTNESDWSSRYFWRLTVSAATPGVDYSANFDIPVFATGEAVDANEFESFQQRRRAAVVRHTVKEASGVAISRLPGGGQEYQLAPAKTAGSVFKSLLFIAIWNAILVALVHYGAPWGFAAFFIVIDVLLLIGSIDFFAGKTTVAVDRAGVRVRKTWFGKGGTQSFAADSIASIDATAISAQNGSSYGIMLKLRDDKTERLGAYIQDRESADIVAAKMMADLGRDRVSRETDM
jgi:hypothetical protein